MKRNTGVIALVALSAVAVGVGAAALMPHLRASRVRHPKTGAPLVLPGQDGNATLLHNGWKISPAGRHLKIGDMPLGGAFSPDGKLYAIVNAGFMAHNLHIVDLATEQSIAKIGLGKAWNGIAWAPDGKRLYVAGGVRTDKRHVLIVEPNAEGKWAQEKVFTLSDTNPQQTCIAGMALSQDGKTLFVLNISDDHLYVVDTGSGTTRSRVLVGNHPVTCRLSPTGKQLYVANWGGAEVAVVEVENLDNIQVSARLKTDQHPNDIALSSDGRCFVSCGSDDAVNVFDVKTRQPLETIKTTLYPKSPVGSTPVALALSADNTLLCVANADNNNVCLVDTSQRGKSKVRGFVPAGWYPSAVAITPDGKRLIVGSGKGSGTVPNPSRQEAPMAFQYIGTQLNGLISFVDMPNAEKLEEYTRQVVANIPYNDKLLGRLASDRKTAIPTRVGEKSPIKYILYIIKENRTYDQIFGAIGKGNGDPNLVLFGRDVTPNHHALAEQFVLLDNLYCNGEVSEDGHPWSTSAYVTDFTQRAWVLGYSAKGRPRDGDEVRDPRNGFIWEACKRKGITYRSYGEYDGHKSLEGNTSLRWVGKGGPNLPAPDRDKDKADIFIEEFKEYERKGNIPRFMIMSLGEDHTNGTRPGTFTPKACVASNDIALGKIVETITKSSVWKEYAIFVIEDDAQNGPDHVDSHRTVGLVISPYVRRKSLDSTLYTTASMLRTMELILGLPPLTQYDAAATPMYACFTDKPDLTPYTPLTPQVNINEKNTTRAFGALESEKMDWSEYDRINEDALNRILWHSIKGRNTPYPTPIRRALLASHPNARK
jgi:DNA-binding beta-propeller fold protein YncE